jgi:hypothetical protein
MGRRGTTLDQAIEKALDRATWRDGATLVQYDDDSFDAIPPIYLTEVMWIGYKHVIRNLGNIRDWVLDAGLHFPLKEGEVEELKDRIRREFPEGSG